MDTHPEKRRHEFADDLATFSSGLDFASLPAPVLHEAKRRLIDSIGVAFAAWDCPPAVAAGSVAMRTSASPGATPFGSAVQSSPDLATLFNGILIRYLDYNDTYLSLDQRTQVTTLRLRSPPRSSQAAVDMIFLARSSLATKFNAACAMPRVSARGVGTTSSMAQCPHRSSPRASLPCRPIKLATRSRLALRQTWQSAKRVRVNCRCGKGALLRTQHAMDSSPPCSQRKE